MSEWRRAEPAGRAGLWAAIFARRSREAPDEMRDKVWTLANCITLFRVVVTVAVLLLAIVERRHELLVGGLVGGMCLDMLDGYVARRRKTETILGAQLDGLADRLAAALALAGAATIEGGAGAASAAAVVWIQYGIVEQFLNTQFLRFGLWSPDHFYLESELVWRLNWSAVAKMASGVPLVLMALGFWWAALPTAVALIAVRAPCYRWIVDSAKRLSEVRPSGPPALAPVGEPGGRAVDRASRPPVPERERPSIAA